MYKYQVQMKFPLKFLIHEVKYLTNIFYDLGSPTLPKKSLKHDQTEPKI